MNADAIYVRGLCLYYEDNVDRAFSHFTQVLRFAPDHAKAKEIYRVSVLLLLPLLLLLLILLILVSCPPTLCQYQADTLIVL